MFHVIWIMIVGLIVGALAKLIMPGRDPGGIFVTMAGFIVSTLGAILILAIYRLLITHRRHPPARVH